MSTRAFTGVMPAAGWRVRSESAPRGLAGANGMRLGPDGALYVVSAFGSEVARVDTRTGELTIVSPLGDGIVSPDDIAFGPDGIMYVTECMNARVTAFDNGATRVIADDLPGANGIDVYAGRIFVDQFLPEGRLWEVFTDGRRPRLLADGLAGPNGLCCAPDGNVYFVQVFTGQVMRMPVDGGPVEEVAAGLSAPSSVRLGPGGLIYVSQGGNGEIATLDPSTGRVTTIAAARPGIDNLAVAGDGRLFISYYIDGAVYETAGRDGLRELVPPGLLGPYGVAVGATGVHIADGLAASRLLSDGSVAAAGKFTDEGFPGYLRGLARVGDGTTLLATTSEGRVARYDPDAVTSELLADGLREPMGVAADDVAAVVAEAGTGRVLRVDESGVTTLAEDLGRPAGVAVRAGDAIYVSDEARGTIEVLDGLTRRTLVGGLSHPHDLCVSGDRLLVIEAGAGRLLSVGLDSGEPAVVAEGLPVGTGDGVRGALNGLPEMIPGPISPFAGLDADAGGRVYIGGDQRGQIVVLEPSA